MTSSPASAAERHQVEGRPVWKTIRLSALDHPNVIAALEGKPPPFPKAVTLEKVKERLARWATIVEGDEPDHPDDITLDGTRWRCGPVAQARVLGRRPTGNTNSVFSESLWQKLQGARKELRPEWPLQIGVDTARFGDDSTCFVVRRGLCTLHVEIRNGWNVPQIANRIKDLAVRYANEKEDPLNIPVLIDDTGVGGGVVDMAGSGSDTFRFIGVNFGWKAEREEEYVNTRSQLWFDFVNIVDHEMCDISRLSTDQQTELRDQLLSPLYELDQRGRRVVESKERTKKRLAQGSPDFADAMILAYSPCPDFFEHYTVLG